MAQTYTLEEAAQRLGLSPENFKRRHKEEWKSLRSFRDGPTLRFRAPDIDELARTLGEASDPELQLTPGLAPKAGDDEVSFSFVDDTPPAKPKAKSKPAKAAHETDEDQPALGSGVNINKPSGKSGKDSDVRIERTGGKSGVPLGLDSSLPTEEIALDLSGPGSAIIRPGQSGKLSAPKSGKIPGPSSKIPGAGGLSKTNNASDDGSSEFELSLDADSDSFELQLASDEDEVDLGSDAGDNLGALSGINLGKPSDSGLLLEPDAKAKSPKSGPKTSPRLPKVAPPKSAPKTSPKTAPAAKAPAGDDDDFDLSLDAPESPKSGKSPKTGPKSDRRQYDSGSDFELTLDDGSGEMAKLADGSVPAEEGQGDIFETDFELPAIDADSGSEVVAVDSDTDVDDSGSDFEMAIDDADAPVDEDESASQVVLVDDEGQAYSEELVEEDAFAGADASEEEASISSVMRQRAKQTDADEDEAEVRTVVAGPARWGPLPAIVLLPTLLVSFLGMLMSFELVRGMWGYHQTTKPGNIVVRAMADQFGMKVSD